MFPAAVAAAVGEGDDADLKIAVQDNPDAFAEMLLARIGEDGQSDPQICQTLSIPAFDQDTCHYSAYKQPKQIGGGYAVDLYFAKT